MKPPFHPARPVNGGPLDKARPKIGLWLYERKWNGWRVNVHVPSLACFNRHGEPLSIAHEFGPALQELQRALAKAQNRLHAADLHGRDRLIAQEAEWADCEGLERRHKRGQGSLIVLDLPMLNLPLQKRGFILREIFCPAMDHCAGRNTVYSSPQYIDGAAEYSACLAVNRTLGTELYEGVVAKRADSFYPLHAANPQAETGLWMKHRWRW